MVTYEQVVNAIMFGNFNTEQVQCLSQALRHRNAQLTKENKREVRIGSVVSFNDRSGRVYTGNVVAVKRKNVVVLTTVKDNRWLSRDTRYNVPAHLLRLNGK